ncbi:hypothetical protein ABVT39_004404, partial [Epinephelus coioides]
VAGEEDGAVQPDGPVDGEGSGKNGRPICRLIRRLLSTLLFTRARPLTAASITAE